VGEKMAAGDERNEMEVVDHNDEEMMVQKVRWMKKVLNEAYPSTVAEEDELMSRKPSEVDQVRD
jgi:hypothetical protein